MLKIEIIVLLTEPPVAAPTVVKLEQLAAKLFKFDAADKLKDGKDVRAVHPLTN